MVEYPLRPCWGEIHRKYLDKPFRFGQNSNHPKPSKLPICIPNLNLLAQLEPREMGSQSWCNTGTQTNRHTVNRHTASLSAEKGNTLLKKGLLLHVKNTVLCPNKDIACGHIWSHKQV